MCNYDPLKVGGRCSETQIQVDQNLEDISYGLNI